MTEQERAEQWRKGMQWNNRILFACNGADALTVTKGDIAVVIAGMHQVFYTNPGMCDLFKKVIEDVERAKLNTFQLDIVQKPKPDTDGK